MKKFMEEFKAFALRGNVMDMAIGVVIFLFSFGLSLIISKITERDVIEY